MSRIASWMPEYDEVARHSIIIDAPIRDVWSALFSVDPLGHPVTRVLMALRSLPLALISPRKAIARLRNLSDSAQGGLKALHRGHFAQLEENEPTNIVLGLTGRFWTGSGGLVATDPGSFREPVPEGLARAAWSFELESVDAGTRLSTETRVRCGGESARRTFHQYWSVIRPFSGLIRIAILNQIRRRARKSVPAAGDV